LFVDASGRVGVGVSNPAFTISALTAGGNCALNLSNGTAVAKYEANGANVYLGSQTAHPVRFLTSNTERLRITSDGKVGIGTSAPEGKLTIRHDSSTVYTSASRGDAWLQIQNYDTTSGIYAGIELRAKGVASDGVANISCIDTGNGNGDLAFGIRNAGTYGEAVRIKYDGNVGIGTTSPDALLTVNGVGAHGLGSAAAPSFAFTGDLNTGIYSPGANQVAISTNGAGRLFVNASGNIGIGTSGATDRLQVEGSASVVRIIGNRTDALGPRLSLGKSRGSSAGSTTIVQSGDEIGQIMFKGADGTDVDSTGASIKGLVDGTPGTNDMPGALVFLTTSDGNNSPSERMRLDSSGRLGLGTSSPNYKAQIAGTSGTVGLGLTGTYASGDSGFYFSPSAVTGSLTAFSSQASASTGVNHFLGNNNSSASTAHARYEAQVNGASAGDPKLVFTVGGVTNWTAGVDNSDSDKFKISNSDSPGSNDRLTIDSSGRVGIATTSPTAQLEIGGNVSLGTRRAAYLRYPGDSANPGRTAFEITANESGTEKAVFKIDGAGSIVGNTFNGTVFRNSGGTERARIDSSGRLGVGTSSPGETIHVNGTLRTTDLKISGSTFGPADLSGSLTIAPHVVNIDQIGGDITLTTGAAGTRNGGAGDIYIKTEDASNQQSGSINISTGGNSGNATPGPILLTAGSSTYTGGGSPDGGLIQLSAGNAVSVVNSNKYGGDVIIRPGTNTASSAFNGHFYIQRSTDAVTYVNCLDVDTSGGTTTFTSAAATSPFIAKINTSEVARIDSSGRLLVGTSTSANTALLQIKGNANGATSYGYLSLRRGELPGTSADLGYIDFADNSGNQGAWIQARRDGGTWTSGSSHPTFLAFSTTADGAASPTERMRISSDGATTLTKTGDNVTNSAALTVGQSNYPTNDATGPQYGIKVNQLGARYTLQIGIGSEIKNTNGYYGYVSFDHFSHLRGIGVYGYSPNSTQAYQESIGVYGKAVGSAQNYNSVYGVAGRANLGETSFSNDNSDYQAGYGGHFVSFGKANSIGVYADAYLDASPGAGTHASPLVCATNGSEILRVTSDKYLRLASGTGGIQFGGDTAAANALDDYEEGTWTPVVTDGTNDGTMNANSAGTYVKVGSLVTCTAYVYASDLSALSGALSIKGLPFTNGSANRNRTGVAIGQVDNVSLGGAYSLAAHIPPGNNPIVLYVNDNATGSTTLQASEVNNTFILNLGFAYRIV
jgi:hypothetical protein